MYDVRPSGAGCGLGCFAARDIVKGETIMEEAPLLRWSMARTAEGAEGQAVPTAAPRSSTMASLGRRADAGELPSSLQSTLRGLEGALAALDPDSRAAFFALSHQNKEETATAAAIWMSNAFALGSADDGSIETDAHDAIETGVFASISRLQHCCRPNADHTWDAALGRKRVVASRDIPSGEEIFLSYLGGSSILPGVALLCVGRLDSNAPASDAGEAMRKTTPGGDGGPPPPPRSCEMRTATRFWSGAWTSTGDTLH